MKSMKNIIIALTACAIMAAAYHLSQHKKPLKKDSVIIQMGGGGGGNQKSGNDKTAQLAAFATQAQIFNNMVANRR